MFFKCLFSNVLQLLNLLSPIVEFHIAQIFTAVKFTTVAKVLILLSFAIPDERKTSQPSHIDAAGRVHGEGCNVLILR